MLQLWTISNLQRLDYSIRKKVIFYAPLVDDLDCYGVGSYVYQRDGTLVVNSRGGARSMVAHVPGFVYAGENQHGLYMSVSGEQTQPPGIGWVVLRFNAANMLNDANTLIWFENRLPKSTPTQTNPFDANGQYLYGVTHTLSHVCKANTVLANSEINAIQTALLDVAQDIPPPPAPPVASTGSPITETPSGDRNGSNTVFTLSQTPDLGSLEIFWAGLYLKRVASAPDTLEFTASGVGNRTLTLGSAPESTHDLTAIYWTVA